MAVLFHPQNACLFFIPFLFSFWISAVKVEAFIKYFVLKWRPVYSPLFIKTTPKLVEKLVRLRHAMSFIRLVELCGLFLRKIP